MKKLELTPEQISLIISDKRYDEAVKWCSKFGVREEMGHHAIARFKVDHIEINAIMFFNNYPLASSPSFNYNSPKISFIG